MKVVINACYGGFSVSPQAALWLYERGFTAEHFATPVDEYFKSSSDGCFSKDKALAKWRKYLKGEETSMFLTIFTPDEKTVLNSHIDSYNNREKVRTDKLLVECVETLGENANGSCAELKVVKVPDGTNFVIEEYDGLEHIAESHRTWD